MDIKNLTLPDSLDKSHTLIRELVKEIQLLKELLNQSSSNSSMPPSTDKKKNKKDKSVSTRKSGGQVGHKGHYRELVEIDQVKNIVVCELPEHCACGGELIEIAGEIRRHQVHELPEIELDITEYQLKKGCCTLCHRKQIAQLPAGISFGITGPRLTALMTQMVCEYRLSRRELKRFLANHFKFPFSLGSVFNKQAWVNQALNAPVAQLQQEIKTSSYVHMDETGHRQSSQKEWIWGAMTALTVVFCIMTSRGKKALKSFMGDYRGLVISDRYAAYNHFAEANRQFCWAHLKRDFTKLAEKSDAVIARIGRGLLEQEKLLFQQWHLFKQGIINRGQLIVQTEPICDQIKLYLEQGQNTAPELRAAGFSKNLLERWDALWNFLYREGVEPTNNHAERNLRHLVIWRKSYFCTHSKAGSEYVARSASIIMTSRLRGLNPFEVLEEIIRNSLLGNTIPEHNLLTPRAKL